MKKVVVILFAVFIAANVVLADQMVIDYSTSDGLGLNADGTVPEAYYAKDSGTLVAWWNGAEGSVGSATTSTWRQLIKWDLSGIQVVQDNLQEGESIQYNSIRMRFSSKHVSDWTQYVQAHYVTSLSTHGEVTWADNSLTTTWDTFGGDFLSEKIPGSYIYPSGSYGTYDVFLDATIIDQWLTNGNMGIMFKGSEDTSEENRCKMLMSNTSNAYTNFDVIPEGTYVVDMTRPLLLIDYEIVPEPATMGVVVLGGVIGLIRKRK